MIQEMISPEKMIEMFTYQVSCEQPAEQVAANVPAACENNRFALLHTYVYHDIVKSKGFPIDRKVYIYEICQAKTAASMLTDFPHFSIFMPCKLAVYENNGKTLIATMNMGAVLDAVRSNPELFEEATRLFDSLKTMINQISNK